jgi:hypothetical protein
VALPISLSENALSFSAISRLNHVEDGIGRHRRSLTLDRAGCGLERLVLIGHDGYVTLEALAWLRAIGASLVQIGRDGEGLAHSVPFGYDGQPIRRAQALAVTNGLDLAIARELIAGKLDAQRRILVRVGADLREFDKLRASLASADSIERVRVIEANAAALYFPAWRDVRIRFRGRDLARIPARWLRCDSRASVLTGAPRGDFTDQRDEKLPFRVPGIRGSPRTARTRLRSHDGRFACRPAQPRCARTRRY